MLFRSGVLISACKGLFVCGVIFSVLAVGANSASRRKRQLAPYLTPEMAPVLAQARTVFSATCSTEAACLVVSSSSLFVEASMLLIFQNFLGLAKINDKRANKKRRCLLKVNLVAHLHKHGVARLAHFFLRGGVFDFPAISSWAISARALRATMTPRLACAMTEACAWDGVSTLPSGITIHVGYPRVSHTGTSCHPCSAAAL